MFCANFVGMIDALIVGPLNPIGHHLISGFLFVSNVLAFTEKLVSTYQRSYEYQKQQLQFTSISKPGPSDPITLKEKYIHLKERESDLRGTGACVLKIQCPLPASY